MKGHLATAGILIAIALLIEPSTGYSQQSASPPSEICPKSADGSENIPDEVVSISGNSKQPETKRTCVKSGTLKDGAGKVCSKGRITWSEEIKGVVAQTSACKEDGGAQKCAPASGSVAGCSPQTLEALRQTSAGKVPVELSAESKDLSYQLFKAQEALSYDPEDTALKARIADTQNKLSISQNADIQRALDAAYPQTYTTNITPPNGVSERDEAGQVTHQFSALTACDGGVCTQETVRGTFGDPKAYIILPSGQPVSALQPTASDMQDFTSQNVDSFDKAWYTSVRDTYMPKSWGQDWYDTNAGQPKFMSNETFRATQAIGADLYGVSALADRVTAETFGKLSVDTSGLSDSERGARMAQDATRYNLPISSLANDGFYQMYKGTPLEASQMSRELVEVDAQLKNIPPELWKSDVTPQRTLSIYQGDGALRGMAAPTLYSSPYTDALTGTFTHETGHDVLFDVAGTQSKDNPAYQNVGNYLYNTPISDSLDKSFAARVPLDERFLGTYARTNLEERLAEGFKAYTQDPAGFARLAAQGGEPQRMQEVLDATLYAHGVTQPIFPLAQMQGPEALTSWNNATALRAQTLFPNFRASLLSP